MARKSLQDRVADLTASAIGIALILLAVLITLVREHPIFSLLVAAATIYSVREFRKRAAMRRAIQRKCAEQIADRQIAKHANALLSYFRQSIRGDYFGNEDTCRWHRHLETFLANQIEPELSQAQIAVDSGLWAALLSHVDAAVRARDLEFRKHVSEREVDPTELAPEEYEQHCANILFRGGWTVQPTPTRGDHGADVIAEKLGQRLIVQCKLYSSSVGNKAVQEVHSARALYNGNYACVVAPNGFTAQAQREAHAHTISLLHHSDLAAYAEELSSTRAIQPPRMALR